MLNDFTLFRVQDDQVDLRQRLTYYPTHTRIPTWLIGVIFGYFLFTRNRGRQIPMSKPLVLTGWFVAFGTMLACMWGPYWRILPDTPDSPLIEGAFFEPLSRTSWALSIGWIVWACYNGHGGLVNDFLSWGFFTGFSRLCYCMYVIHRIVQLVNAARLQTDTHFSNYDAVCNDIYIATWWAKLNACTPNLDPPLVAWLWHHPHRLDLRHLGLRGTHFGHREGHIRQAGAQEAISRRAGQGCPGGSHFCFRWTGTGSQTRVRCGDQDGNSARSHQRRESIQGLDSAALARFFFHHANQFFVCS